MCEAMGIRWTPSEKSLFDSLVMQLTHYGLVTPYGNRELGQHCSGNGLLPDGTKPLPEPMLTCHQ